MGEIDEVFLQRLSIRAKRMATKKGYESESSDFSSWIIERYLSGKSQHQLLDHSLIDYIRELNGRKARSFVEFKDSGEWDQRSFIHLSDLTREERLIIILKYKWGLTLDEIGECFGLSESRICAIQKKAYNKLKGRYEKQSKKSSEA